MSGFSPAFERLGAAHAAIAAQQQEALVDLLPAADWSADLTTGTYTQGEVSLRVALLGSFAEEGRNWLWGWANPQFGPDQTAVVTNQATGTAFAINVDVGSTTITATVTAKDGTHTLSSDTFTTVGGVISQTELQP